MASKFVALKVSEAALPRPKAVTVTLAGEVHLEMTELPPPAWLAEVVEAIRGIR